MRGLEGIVAANETAIRKEYREAVTDGNWTLAARILQANPGLFPRGRCR